MSERTEKLEDEHLLGRGRTRVKVSVTADGSLLFELPAVRRSTRFELEGLEALTLLRQLVFVLESRQKRPPFPRGRNQAKTLKARKTVARTTEAPADLSKALPLLERIAQRMHDMGIPQELEAEHKKRARTTARGKW